MEEITNAEVVRSEPRPWLRFLARKIDIALYTAIVIIPIMLMFVALGFLGVERSIIDSTAFSLFMGAVYIILLICVEAFVLFWWDNTPGKKLLGITLKKEDNSSFGFGDTFERTARLWFSGLGLGLPLISLITQILSYSRLEDKKITSWDEKCHIIVTHAKINSIRIAIAAVLTIFIFGAEIYFNIMSV